MLQKYWLQYQLLRNITHLWLLVRTADNYYSVSLTALPLFHPFFSSFFITGSSSTPNTTPPQFTARHRDAKSIRADLFSFNGERMSKASIKFLGLFTPFLMLPNLFSTGSVSWIYLFASEVSVEVLVLQTLCQ